MANPFDIANFNLTNFANILPDVLDSDPKTVEYTYKDANGNILTKNVENRGLFKQHLWDDVGGALGQFNRTSYVDVENGDDNNDGSSSAPFKTLDKAIDAIPTSGVGYINIVGDYVIDGGKSLGIDDGKRISINIGNNARLISECVFDGSYNSWGTFKIEGNAHLRIYLYSSDDESDDITEKILIKEIANSDYPTKPSRQGLIGFSSISHFSNLSCVITGRMHHDIAWIKQLGGKLFYRYNWDSDNTPFCSFTISKPHYTGNLVIRNGLLMGDLSTLTWALNFQGINLVDEDGNEVSISDVIGGIIRDAGSGNPINLISNVNFSD